MSEVKLFNTLTRSVEPLQPISANKVALYCCGPTVYNYQHIGNLRTYIFEDLLVRMLRYTGYTVEHVMNITDVGHLVSDADEGEDKMLVAAQREGRSSHEIAEFYTKIFFDHCALLNIKRPDTVCKATDHIPQMIKLIERLVERGLAYLAGGNVYFDTQKFPSYGRLAMLDLESLQAGARIEVDKQKHHPLDFALWFTKSKFEGQELQWESPWGRGYPGWHIECSAMAMHYLGESFDIHCGGIDHIPVHHTNEIAQSEGATGRQFARVWMHGGFLVTDKSKMSKSTGEFLTLDRLIERGFDPLVYRLFCFSAHYRSELSWSWEALAGAANSLERIRKAVVGWREDDSASSAISAPGSALIAEFEEAITNDLNLPKALAVVFEVLNEKEITAAEKLRLVYHFDTVLGLDLENYLPHSVEIPERVSTLVEQREKARSNRDWKEADRLREAIAEAGFLVEDTKAGYVLRPKAGQP